ncbi:hypothetical protein KCU71_g3334, partial [Aureobasidium melanogenum]
MERRVSYPIQTSPDVSPISAIPSEKVTARPSTPQLPRYIHATENGTTTKGRTLIICLDGTGDKFDGDNSNIVHLVSCLKKDDPHQITYYQSGIGT